MAPRNLRNRFFMEILGACLIVHLVLPRIVTGQSFVRWKRVDGQALTKTNWQSVLTTQDGGIIVSGLSGDYPLNLLKVDGDGNTVWQRNYFILHFADNVRIVRTKTASEEFLLAATNWASSDGLACVRIDSVGDTLWTRRFKDTNNPFTLGRIIATHDGGFVLAGRMDSSLSGAGRACVWKLDSIGTIIWTHAYGNSLDDSATAVQELPDGTLIVAGRSHVAGVNWDIWVMKIGASGDFIWRRTYGGEDEEQASALELGPSDDFYIVGSTRSFGSGGWDAWVLRGDIENGDTLWTRAVGGSEDDQGYDLIVNSDSTCTLVGTTQSFIDPYWSPNSTGDVLLAQLNQDGAFIQHQEFAYATAIGHSAFHTNGAFAVSILGGGDIAVAGYSSDVYTDYNLLESSGGLARVHLPETRTSVQEGGPSPRSWALLANFPNPFNPITTIPFVAADQQFVTIKIYDVLGRQVALLISEQVTPGRHQVQWRADNFPTGVYYCRLETSAISITRKILLLK